jgi:hypothetical protein
MRELISPGRLRAARALAVGADFLQVALLPIFVEGWLSPVNNVLDVVVAIAMIRLLGWHWAFAPAFVSELVPVMDLVPTWTAAVFIATAGRATAAPEAAAPAALPSPPSGKALRGPDQPSGS